jgi:hypothetical protein
MLKFDVGARAWNASNLEPRSDPRCALAHSGYTVVAAASMSDDIVTYALPIAADAIPQTVTILDPCINQRSLGMTEGIAERLTCQA